MRGLPRVYILRRKTKATSVRSKNSWKPIFVCIVTCRSGECFLVGTGDSGKTASQEKHACSLYVSLRTPFYKKIFYHTTESTNALNNLFLFVLFCDGLVCFFLLCFSTLISDRFTTPPPPRLQPPRPTTTARKHTEAGG